MPDHALMTASTSGVFCYAESRCNRSAKGQWQRPSGSDCSSTASTRPRRTRSRLARWFEAEDQPCVSGPGWALSHLAGIANLQNGFTVEGLAALQPFAQPVLDWHARDS